MSALEAEREERLVKVMRELAPEWQQEVLDFAEFLLAKRGRRPRGTPTFSWAAALSDLRDQYTSVELQHKITEWRCEEL